MLELSTILPVALALVVVAVTAFVYWLSKPLLVAYRSKRSPDYEVERFYLKEDGKSKAPFPSVFDEPTRLLTVVVPAYNETDRINIMMDEMLAHLQSESKNDRAGSTPFTWEIIVVDDGSKDDTAAKVQSEYVSRYGSDKVRVCKLFKNNGKGGAVRKGMLRARGQYILMADADGATKASDLATVFRELRSVESGGLGIAVGSRAHMEDAGVEAKAKRSPLRKLLMWGFHTLMSLLVGGHDIKDTQCGFKMFTRKSAALLFPVQHIERWAFDVELLFLAVRFRIPLVEVPVNWHEVDGSKLDAFSATLQMARDMFIIRLCYTLGIWTDKDGGSQAFVKADGDTSNAAAAAATPASPRSSKSAKRNSSLAPVSK